MEKTPMKGPVLVSACLLGLKTRHDGTDAISKEAMDALSGRVVIAFCPEQSGGLPTPRRPASILSGDGNDVLDGRTSVLDISGTDVTANFIRGAENALQAARLAGASEAYLKEKSPSCGVNLIYNGESVVQGCGVTAALLGKNSIKTTAF